MILHGYMELLHVSQGVSVGIDGGADLESQCRWWGDEWEDGGELGEEEGGYCHD